MFKNIKKFQNNVFGEQFMRAARILFNVFDLADLESAIRLLKAHRSCRPIDLIKLDEARGIRTSSSGNVFNYLEMPQYDRELVTAALARYSLVSIQDAIYAVLAHPHETARNDFLYMMETRAMRRGEHRDESMDDPDLNRLKL